MFVQLIQHASVWYAQNLSLFFWKIKTDWPNSYFLQYWFLTISEFFSCYCNKVCKTYSRAYIHCLVTKDAMGSQLLSYHNLYYMMKVAKPQLCDEIYLSTTVKIFRTKHLNKIILVFYFFQLSRDLHLSIVEGQFPRYVYLFFLSLSLIFHRFSVPYTVTSVVLQVCLQLSAENGTSVFYYNLYDCIRN